MNYLLKIKAAAPGVIHRVFPTLTLLGILLAVAACSADDGLPREAGGRAIGFRAAGAGAASRATVTTSVRKIGVFGYSHTGSFTDALNSRFPDYFLNQPVLDKAGNGIWSYDGVTKYWPREGINVSFFAYAPYIDVENTFTLHPSVMADKGTPTIAYTVPANIYDQVDLLWSNALDQTYATNNGTVAFTMEHALTRVDFQIKLDDEEKERPFVVTIKSLKVENVTGSGTLDLSKSPSDASLWTTTRPANDSGWDSYVLTPASGGGLRELVFDARTTVTQQYDPYTYTPMFASGEYLMLIPQCIDSQPDDLSPAQVTIAYSYANVYSGETFEDEKTIALARPALSLWNPGQGVTYQMQLSLVDGITVELEIEGFITGTPWDDANSTNPVTGSVN